MRLGVIGCEHGLNSHIVPGIGVGFVLGGVYDTSEEQAKTAIRLGGNKKAIAFESDVALVHSDLIDAVIIASPDEFHPLQLKLAVEAGKPVLVEKPLAITAGGMKIVRQAFTIAKHKNVYIVSCHPRRCRKDPYGWVKENLSKLVKTYGPLEHIDLSFSYPPPKKSWKTERSLLLDHYPHEIDYLRWLLGDRPFRAERLQDRFDIYKVTGVLSGDISFLFTGNRTSRSSVYQEEIRLRFERGECTVDATAGKVWHRARTAQSWTEKQIGPIDYDQRFANVMSDFLAAIKRPGANPNDKDLLVNTESAIALAGPRGVYRYSGS